MRTALILEDDQTLALTLEQILKNKGLQVFRATSLQEAYYVAKSNSYTLAIIDRVLPDGDGLEFVEELAATNFLTRVLVLTNQSITSQKVLGLSLGADDYLGKPFSYQELSLRIDSLLTKHKIYAPQIIIGDNITLYCNQCLLQIDGHQAKLRLKETQILSCLIKHQGMVVTNQILLDLVWRKQEVIPLPKTISVYVRRIRMKMGEYSFRLKTVRGIGYRLL